MWFRVQMYLTMSEFQRHSDITTVVSLEDFRNHELHVSSSDGQLLVYGKETKKTKQEFPNIQFVDSPESLFRAANNKDIWIRSKELFPHLSRWIGDIYTNDREIEQQMRQGRTLWPGSFTEFAWKRNQGNYDGSMAMEFFIKPYSSLPHDEKQRILDKVLLLMNGKIDSRASSVLKDLAISIKVKKDNRQKTYTVDFVNRPLGQQNNGLNPRRNVAARFCIKEDEHKNTIDWRISIHPFDVKQA